MDQINFRNHNYVGKGHSPPQSESAGRAWAVGAHDNFSVKMYVIIISQMKYGSCGSSYILETEKTEEQRCGLFKLPWVKLKGLLNPGLGCWLQTILSPLCGASGPPRHLGLPPSFLGPSLTLARGHCQVLLLQRKWGYNLSVHVLLNSSWFFSYLADPESWVSPRWCWGLWRLWDSLWTQELSNPQKSEACLPLACKGG